MMKKVWLILLAVVLVFGFAVLGCSHDSGGGGGGGGDGGGTDPDGPKVVYTNILDDNFEYGNGYQGLVDAINKKANNKVVDFGKITKDKDYTIKVSFKASRDFEDDLQVGLVDRDPGDPPADADWNKYWRWLTSTLDADSTMATKEEINAARAADKTVDKIMTFTAKATAKGDNGNQNSFAFQTKGEGTEGTKGSGAKGPVTLTFYVFEFIEGDEEDLPVDPVDPGEPELTFDTAVGLKGLAVSGEGAISVDTTTGIISRGIDSGYGNYLSVAIPADQLPIIASDTIKITYIGKGNAPATTKRKGSSGGDDLTTADYFTFTGNDTVQTKEIKAVLYGDLLPTTVLWFQGRPNAAAWQLKIISITVVHGDPIKVTTAIAIKPVAGETPVTSLDNLQYSGTVSWAPTAATFAAGTAYTATIALTAKAGYTFSGIDANTFPVTGATTGTHVVGTDTLSITAVFPATAAPAPDKDVTFAAGDIKVVNGSVVIETDGKGFTFTTTQGNKYAFPTFEVEFADGRKLSDYTKISYKITSSGTDSTYKVFNINALAAEPTSAPLDDTAKINVESDWNGTGVGDANKEYAHTVTIKTPLPTGTDLNKVWIAIYSTQAGAGIIYKVTDIKFHN